MISAEQARQNTLRATDIMAKVEKVIEDAVKIASDAGQYTTEIDVRNDLLLYALYTLRKNGYYVGFTPGVVELDGSAIVDTNNSRISFGWAVDPIKYMEIFDEGIVDGYD